MKSGSKHSADSRRVMSETMTRKHRENPEWTRQMAQTKRAQFTAMTPDERKVAFHSTIGGYQRWLGQGGREVRSAQMKRQMKEPSMLEKARQGQRKYFASITSEELNVHNARLRKVHTTWLETTPPEERKHQGPPRGPEHFNWVDGGSVRYSPEFTASLRGAVKRRDGCCCILCSSQTRLLDVHHVDYYKRNSDPLNLVTLCRPCHSKTNFQRGYWQQVFDAVIQTKVQIGVFGRTSLVA